MISDPKPISTKSGPIRRHQHPQDDAVVLDPGVGLEHQVHLFAATNTERRTKGGRKRLVNVTVYVLKKCSKTDSMEIELEQYILHIDML